MNITFIAILGSLSCSSFIWLIFHQLRTKSIQDERISEIMVSKVMGVEKNTPSPKLSKFSSERRRKKRNDDVSIAFVILGALPISAVWFVAQPTLYVVKYILSAVILLITRRLRLMIIKRKYRQEIEETLPIVLDLLVVCIEAGMSIHTGMVRVAEEMKGTALSSELRNTFFEMEVGLPLDEAFRNLGRRTGVEDVQALATSIIQGEKLGISLGDTLRSQAKFVRESLRMKTKEKILKTPVKIVLPLVFCILPALFIVLLTPAFVNIKKEIIDKNKGNTTSQNASSHQQQNY